MAVAHRVLQGDQFRNQSGDQPKSTGISHETSISTQLRPLPVIVKTGMVQVPALRRDTAEEVVNGPALGLHTSEP